MDDCVEPMKPIKAGDTFANSKVVFWEDVQELKRERDEAVRLLQELYASEEGPGKTDRPYFIKLRSFLVKVERL